MVSKRVVLADVPPDRKPERGYIRQNHPFTKPPFYLLLKDFSLLVAFLLVTFSWLFHGFSVALFCLEQEGLGLVRGFLVAVSWLWRFGQNLHVLALEQSISFWLTHTRSKTLGRTFRSGM